MDINDYYKSSNIEAAFVEANKKYQQSDSGIESLNDIEKDTMLVCWFTNSITGGGIDTYFYDEVSNHYSVLKKTLLKINAEVTLNILDQFEKSLSLSELPESQTERITLIEELMEKNDELFWDTVSEISDKLMSSKENPEKKLLEYYS